MAAKKLSRPGRPSAKPKPLESLMGAAKRIPDAPKRRRTILRGRHCKLGFLETWASIFSKNEDAPIDQKLTDDQIKLVILEEFPNKPGLKLNLNGQYNVQYYRNMFNRGLLTHGSFPAKVAFRYNEQGLAVDTRTGKRVLTPLERKLWVKEYGRRHERDTKNRQCKRKENVHAKQSTPPADPDADQRTVGLDPGSRDE